MKTGIVMVTLGGPRSLEEIPEFIRNFLGRELPPPAMRAVIERYRLIGGFSPLTKITEDQAQKLGNLVGHDYICAAAFRHCRPFIEDALERLAAEKVGRLFFLLLSPFYASVTTGDYLAAVEAYRKKASFSIPVQYIHSWYGEPLFIESWAEKIRGESLDTGAYYLFSAHSLPMKYTGEPYRRQIEETMKQVASRTGIVNYDLGWQSIPQNAQESWIGPTVEEKIDAIAAAGFAKVIQVPIGFTADHIETLYDIDITHRRYAEGKGLAFRRISSLNAGDAFIRALQEIVMKAVREQ